MDIGFVQIIQLFPMLFNVFIADKSSGYIFYKQQFDSAGFGVAGWGHGGWLMVEG
jgi:hypothetical protein